MLHYKKCVKCGKRFGTNYPRKVYCSNTCLIGYIKKRYRRKCAMCEKEFECKTHGRRKIYCGKKCANNARQPQLLNRSYKRMLNSQIEKTERYLNMAIEKLAYYKKMREEFEQTKRIPSWSGINMKNPLDNETAKRRGVRLSQSDWRRRSRK